MINNDKSQTKLDTLLSIVIVTYNRAIFLGKVVNSLLTQSLSAEKFEIIIVDNNSTDETHKVSNNLITQFQNYNIRYVLEIHQGISYARNRGIKEAKGRYIAFIDDDAKADSNWCERILATFRNPDISPDIIGGIILPWFAYMDKPVWADNTFQHRSWGAEPRLLNDNERKTGFSGSNMAFKKEIFENYGVFSTKFGMKSDKIGLGEETDLFFRLSMKKDIKFWYDPKIIVYHLLTEKHFSIKFTFSRAYHSGKSNSIIFNINKKIFHKILLLLTIPIELFVFTIKYLFIFNRNRNYLLKKTAIIGYKLGIIF